jgi:hypothetical protein
MLFTIASPIDSVQNPASAKSSPALSDCRMQAPPPIKEAPA